MSRGRARRSPRAVLGLGGACLALLGGAAPTLADNSPGLGKIVFSSNRGGHYDIYSVASDGSQISAAGSDVPARLTDSPGDDAEPAWSPDGRSIVFTRVTAGQGDLWVIAADGSGAHALTTDGISEHHPAFSPSGQMIAYRRRGEIWIMGADGSRPRAITRHAFADEPAFSPDGGSIVFTSTRDGAMDPATGAPLRQIYTLDLTDCAALGCDAAADPRSVRRLTAPQDCAGRPGRDSDNRGPSFSPDGRQILFRSTRCVRLTGRDVFVMNADGTNANNLTALREADRDASWAPDGQGIVFVSTRDRTPATPRDENVYVARKDGSGARRLTTNPADDTHPRWYYPPGGLPAGTPGSGVDTPDRGDPSDVGSRPGPRSASLRLVLRAAKRQRILRHHGRLTVRVRCNIACRVTLKVRRARGRGRLRFHATRVNLSAGAPRRVALRLSRRQLGTPRHRHQLVRVVGFARTRLRERAPRARRWVHVIT